VCAILFVSSLKYKFYRMMLHYSTVFIARETNVIRNCEFLGSFLLEKDNQTTEVGCSAFFLYITLSVGELFFYCN